MAEQRQSGQCNEVSGASFSDQLADVRRRLFAGGR